MAAVAVTGGTLSLTPKAGAYFYENIPCENAATDGFAALSFTLAGPAQSSFLIELQTKANCADTAVKRAYHNVPVPATASPITDFGRIRFPQNPGALPLHYRLLFWNRLGDRREGLYSKSAFSWSPLFSNVPMSI